MIVEDGKPLSTNVFLAINDRQTLTIDPYYFLQYDSPNTPATSTKAFPVSFLSLDVDGRVIRIDR